MLSEVESRQRQVLQQRFASSFVGTKVFPERVKMPNIRSSRLELLAGIFKRCREKKLHFLGENSWQWTGL